MDASVVMETEEIGAKFLAYRLFVCTNDYRFEVLMDDPFTRDACSSQKFMIERALRSSGVKLIEEKSYSNNEIL